MDQKLYRKIIELGQLVLNFGKVNRATFHEDGVTPESDTDHTVMLGIIACSYAERFAPELNRGRIAEFALIHDLVEVYAGDTATLKHMSPGDQRDKAEREHAAYERIQREFGEILPWVHEIIAAYERLDTREARFVKTLDKSMPGITHTLNGGVVVKSFGHTSDSLRELRQKQRQTMQSTYAHDQGPALDLWEFVVAEEEKREGAREENS